MAKSKGAKHRHQLKAAYEAKARAAEQPAAERAVVLIALDFALNACAQTAEAEIGLTVKTLEKLQRGFPITKLHEECIMRGASAMGFRLEPQ